MNQSYQKYEEHINYEFNMFEKTSIYLMNKYPHQNNQGVILNDLQDLIYLECFLLHYRNLFEFFIESKGYPTDLKANMFLFNWEQIKVKFEDNIKKIKESILYNYEKDNLINKYLSHITEERNNIILKKSWDIKTLYENMKIICDEFKKLIINSRSEVTFIFEAEIPKKSIKRDISNDIGLTTFTDF
jgi:hypothetical protein